MKYASIRTFPSGWAPGVTYQIERMSFGRRQELTKQVRGLLARQEFHAVGDSPLDKVEAALLSMEIDRIYWNWGLVSLEGLFIGDEIATKENVFERGPEPLVCEILLHIKSECGLSEEERKN